MLLENGETSVGVDYLKACYDVSLKQHRLESKCFALRISSGGVPRDFIYQRNQKPETATASQTQTGSSDL